MEQGSQDSRIRQKMVEAGISAPAIRSFEDNVKRLSSGGDGLIRESDISPVADLPRLDDVGPLSGREKDLGAGLAVIKLNGGLGTGMGLDRAKSLLEVKDGLTFLDLIAKQILALRENIHPGIQFLLMNSFVTREDSLRALEKYPGLSLGGELDFLQSKVPKIDVETMVPVEWPENPALEWCPPGHGDLYLSFFASGQLDSLIQKGVKYAFISNSDNLGAFPDLRVIDYMDREDIPFLMEVTPRTEADRKGGHLARRKSDGRLILREGAQCPTEETDSFQDIARYRYFNTNNLWVRLDHLRAAVSEHGGFLPLPLICNRKHVDPTRADSPEVFQLETAMGAAIEMFEGARALEVPRTRFAPVKKTEDLMALRSDCYEMTAEFQVRLVESRDQRPPDVQLDSKYYKFISDFDRLVGCDPSLKNCESLTISGPVEFQEPVTFGGRVEVVNQTGQPLPCPSGSYSDETIHVSS